MKKIHEILKQTRKNKKITQADISKITGICQPHISKFEKGEEVNLSTAEQIADALDMSITAIPKNLLYYVESLVRVSADSSNAFGVGTQSPTKNPYLFGQSEDLLNKYRINDDK